MDENNEAEESGLTKVLASFVHDVDSLNQMLDSAMFMVRASEGSEEENFKEFANRYGETIPTDSGGVEYKFPREYAAQATRLLRQWDRAVRGFALVPRSFVVSLVSIFDSYVGSLLSAIYRKRPELLNASERSLSFAELKKFGSVADWPLFKELGIVSGS